MGTIREYTKRDGSKSFHAEIRLRGHPTERDNFRTRGKAKKWIQDTESAIRDGRHVKTSEAKRHTVGGMIDRFIDQWLSKYPDRKAKQSIYLKWWKQECGHLILANLTPAVIAQGRDKLLNEMTAKKQLRNPSTVNRYLSAFGKVLIIAVKEWGWLEESPMPKVSKPQEGEGRERFLSIDEKNRLLEACCASRNPNLFPIVTVALNTAMRYGEIAGLRWQDIDFENQKIILHRTKNGDRRYIPLTSEVVSIFKSCPTFGISLNEFIFQSNRHTLKKQKVSIREAFENAVKRANIENFRFHDLRHTAASYMAMSGATQGELMAILGHRSPSMTQRYAHYSQEHLKKVLEKAQNLSDKPKGIEL